MIRDLLDEIERTTSAGFFRVALTGVLTVPDIAGALDAIDGRATGARYAQWFDRYVAPRYAAFGTQYLTGRDCYQYRCVLLHQGRQTHPKNRYTRSVFLFAPKDNIAYCGAFTLDGGNTLAVDVPVFCRNMLDAARHWLDAVENTALFQTNSADALELFRLTFAE